MFIYYYVKKRVKIAVCREKCFTGWGRKCFIPINRDETLNANIKCKPLYI